MQRRTNNAVDMSAFRKVHFIGIGGCGMSAIAKVLIKMGFKVTGSDIKESINTIRLKDLGARIFIDHNKDNVRGADMVVLSTAIPADNEELYEAQQAKIPVYQRADILSWIMDQFRIRIAVAGTHGKTTTTSMIASVLLHAGSDPTFLIGGDLNSFDGNARLGSGGIVVAEADESDKSFMKLHPTISIVTNIEDDHIENYGSFENILRTFHDFIGLLPQNGTLIINNDSQIIKDCIKDINGKKIITYGFTDKSDYHADNFKFFERRTKFDVFHAGSKVCEITLCVPGKQNILNALAAMIAGLETGCGLAQIAMGLQIFLGAKRRFQILGDTGDILVIDDYGHHPTEIRATLQAARLGYGDARRIISIFQPHRYSRTMHFHKEFGKAFSDSDLVIVTDIYSANEEPIIGVSAKMIADEISKNGKEAIYIGRKEKVADHVMKIMKPKDIILTIGAGDIFVTGKEIASRLKARAV